MEHSRRIKSQTTPRTTAPYACSVYRMYRLSPFYRHRRHSLSGNLLPSYGSVLRIRVHRQLA